MKVLSLSDNVYDYYCNLDKMYPGGNAVNVSSLDMRATMLAM